eukprot:GHVH01007424.1.p1 GENE.GHVH01007424.1~~GHVH01007424.1.p1  ORF type:complete len:197 (+),score=26.17 GHVH01007424.1:708-1298(+)
MQHVPSHPDFDLFFVPRFNANKPKFARGVMGIISFLFANGTDIDVDLDDMKKCIGSLRYANIVQLLKFMNIVFTGRNVSSDQYILKELKEEVLVSLMIELPRVSGVNGNVELDKMSKPIKDGRRSLGKKMLLILGSVTKEEVFEKNMRWYYLREFNQDYFWDITNLGLWDERPIDSNIYYYQCAQTTNEKSIGTNR